MNSNTRNMDNNLHNLRKEVAACRQEEDAEGALYAGLHDARPAVAGDDQI